MCTTYRQFMRALEEINQKPYLETNVNVFGRTVFTHKRDVADIDCVSSPDDGETTYRVEFSDPLPSFPLLPGFSARRVRLRLNRKPPLQAAQ